MSCEGEHDTSFRNVVPRTQITISITFLSESIILFHPHVAAGIL